MFKKYDRDGKGYINERDIEQVIKSLDEKITAE